MASARPRMLFVSDLTYQANGRRYCDEDIFLSSRLRETFDVAVCHPLDVVALMASFDVVVVRNSGPVVDYLAAYKEFHEVARHSGRLVYNQLEELLDGGLIAQPRVDFRYELSFYFVDHEFHYALHAPRTDQRWALEPYEPMAANLEFAQVTGSDGPFPRRMSPGERPQAAGSASGVG